MFVNTVNVEDVHCLC